MADIDAEKKKETLKVGRPNTLSLTKTVESGKVKQNFTHGRSKTVQVEVRKTRNFTRKQGGGMVEVAKDAPAAGGKSLSKAEQEARLKALQQGDKTSLKADYKVPRPQKKEEAQRENEVVRPKPAKPDLVMDDVAAKNLAAMQKNTPRPDAPAQHSPAKKSKPSDDDSSRKTKMKLKDDDGWRKGGKLTVTQALSMDDNERSRSLASVKRARAKARKEGTPSSEQEKRVREVIVPEVITVQELANRMAERAVDVIKALMKLGTMATAQQSIDADTAELIIEEFGHTIKRVSDSDVEDVLVNIEDKPEDMKSRAPVVTVMGHVDHGKTSLLDALRQTDVVAGEAGGITQHIGAYQVEMESGAKITFLDTPGHEAFTAMRLRGAKATDVVVLVVAADDGIKPQTVEAINHAKAAEVPIIVAVNKIDKPEADPDKVKNELMQHELVPEEYGGDIMVFPVSAKEKMGLTELEEGILLQSEVLELKANPDAQASGIVIESKVDKGRGVVATLLMQRGTLNIGDVVVAGATYGRVRAILNDKGQNQENAIPSLPVEILGLSDAPQAGDEFAVVDNEKTARDITEYREKRQKELHATATAKSLDQMFAAAGAESVKEFNMVVKGDVHGSVEAIMGSLAKFDDEEVKVKALHTAVGAITESDVSLAMATNAAIVGFNVRATPKAREMAEKENVNIRYYSVIYDVIDDVKKALSGMLSPELRENIIGYAEIQEVFNITKSGKVAGCKIIEGLVKRGAGVRLLRDNVVIHEGKLKTLKRFKEEVKEVKNGFECGMAFENYEDIKVGDQIECYEIQELARVIENKKEKKEPKEAAKDESEV